MGRIAVIADIHGNLPALEAVLADLESAAPDEVLVAGDLVGRGPQGREVVEAIAAGGWRALRGNHEDYLLSFRRREVPEDWWETEEWAASRWMAAQLGEEAARYIAELPFALEPATAPDLLLIHGSPRSNNEGLGPWTSDRELDRHLVGIRQEVLVCAHTHRPMVRRLADGLVVNVGSVGLPFNGDRRAQYAILEHRDGRWEVETRQVDYPLAAILEVYRASGFLAAGGITAELLRLELVHARPLLVPFLKWAAATGREPGRRLLEEFLELFDPHEPLADFFRRLHSLGRRLAGSG